MTRAIFPWLIFVVFLIASLVLNVGQISEYFDGYRDADRPISVFDAQWCDASLYGPDGRLLHVYTNSNVIIMFEPGLRGQQTLIYDDQLRIGIQNTIEPGFRWQDRLPIPNNRFFVAGEDSIVTTGNIPPGMADAIIQNESRLKYIGDMRKFLIEVESGLNAN